MHPSVFSRSSAALRYLPAIAFITAFVSVAEAGAAFVQQSSKASASASLSKSAVAGDMLLVGIGYSGGSIGGVRDSLGNAFTAGAGSEGRSGSRPVDVPVNISTQAPRPAKINKTAARRAQG